jgi:hypothetical protein
MSEIKIVRKTCGVEARGISCAPEAMFRTEANPGKDLAFLLDAG